MSNETYVATAPLFIGVTRAANIGDEIPADTVTRAKEEGWGWDGKVAKSTTKAAEEALASLGGDPEPKQVSKIT